MNDERYKVFIYIYFYVILKFDVGKKVVFFCIFGWCYYCIISFVKLVSCSFIDFNVKEFVIWLFEGNLFVWIIC